MTMDIRQAAERATVTLMEDQNRRLAFLAEYMASRSIAQPGTVVHFDPADEGE